MNAIIVAKTPKVDVLRAGNPALLEEMQRRDAQAWDSLEASARRQRASLESVQRALTTAGVRAQLLSRADFFGPRDDTDFVVAVGGDGTVLEVSHWLRDTPLLGVNSDPESSIGYFCASSAEGLPGVLDAVVRGTAPSVNLHRIALTVNGGQCPYPCLNDILLSNANPAAMSRYVIAAGDRSESQSSSGVWISTPAGSTGGVRSAGGTVLPLEGALMQYLVREPYTPRVGRYELQRGVRHLREGLRFKSRMPEGRLYLDGPYIELPFGMGDVLELGEGPSLRVLGMHPNLRER